MDGRRQEGYSGHGWLPCGGLGLLPRPRPLLRSGVLLCVLLQATASWGESAVTAEPPLPAILAGCEPDYPPYCVATESGQADGFSVELLRASLKAVGREVTFRVGPWSELRQDLADGRRHVLPLVGRTPERESVYDFTFPYLTMHGAIVVREDNRDIHGPADLAGKQVAVLQGDNAEEYLRRSNLGAAIVTLPSFETALRELAHNRHDAVVIQKLLALQLMKQADLTNLKVVGPPLKDFKQSFCFAVRKGDGELLALLNEGLSIVIADGTFRTLYARWFSTLETAARTRSRLVVGGDSDYPPYEFLDRNGQPAGFNVDLTRAIARQMGISAVIRLWPWHETRQRLEAGDIDAVQGMFYSTERDHHLDFAPPSTIVHHAIVTRKGEPEPAGMGDLTDKSILVMAGDIMEDLAVKQGHGKQLIAVASQEEALRLLASGQGDCALVATVPAHYWIEKKGWRNLRVSRGSVLSAEYCYAVPHQQEELLALFTGGLAALKATGEYRELQARWLSPYEAPGVSARTVAPIVLAVVAPLLVLLGLSFLWSRSLQGQVAARTRELSFDNALLAAQSNATIDGILVVDDKATILSYNRRFVDMWGLPPELVERKVDEPVLRHVTGSLSNPEQFLRRVQYLYEHKEETSHEELILKDGRVFDRYSAPISDPRGHYYGRVWYFRDITTLKQNEKHLEEALAETRRLLADAEQSRRALLSVVEDQKRAEEALKTANLRMEEAVNELRHTQGQIVQQERLSALGQMASGIAHDFNNLLIPLLGYSELMLADPAVLDDREETRDLLTSMLTAAKDARSLVRRLREFYHPDDTLETEAVDLQTLIDESLALTEPRWRQQAQAQGLTVAPRVECGELPKIYCNRAQMREVFTNLIFNAADAMPEGGTITIRAHREGDGVRIDVSDTGIGMSDDVRRRCFEPFFTTKGAHGTGMGLAMVHGVVQRHGGRATLESQKGKGTTVTIHLPLRPHGNTAASKPASVPQLARHLRILVVDDEASVLSLIARLLRKEPYHVETTTSAQEGLEKLRMGGFDLVITDRAMPGLSGDQMAAAVKQHSPKTLVILLTGFGEIMKDKGELPEGVDFILGKPVTRDELLGAITRVMA